MYFLTIELYHIFEDGHQMPYDERNLTGGNFRERFAEKKIRKKVRYSRKNKRNNQEKVRNQYRPRKKASFKKIKF